MQPFKNKEIMRWQIAVEEVDDAPEDCLEAAAEVLAVDQVDKKVEEVPTAEKLQLKLLVL